jgi:large subunit ribosomal protein L16
MLMPKRTKYRKIQKGKMKGRSKGGRSLFFGDYGLVAVEPGRITSRQIEAMRVTLSRRLKKVGSLFLRIFPDRAITKKAAETRMGKGKGNPEYWVSVVKRERILCEISGVDITDAKRILKAATYKLPVKTKFISKENSGLVSS